MKLKTPRFFIGLCMGVFSLLFVLYLSILIAFPRSFNINAFTKQIETEFNNQTGLQLGIENVTLRTSISPYINIDAYHVGILNPDNTELLKIKDMNIKIKVFPILMKKISIEKITINRPIIAFEIESDGKCTLDKYLQTKFKTKMTGFSLDNKMPEIEINRYKAKIYDKNYSTPFITEGNKLELSPLHFSEGFKMVTKGKITHNDVTYINYNTDIENHFFEKKDKLFNTNPFKYLKKYQIKANILTKIQFKKIDNKIKAMGMATVNDLSFVVNKILLEDNHIGLKIDDNNISINADIKTDVKNRMQVFGTYHTGHNKNIDMQVKAQDANISSLKETMQTILNAFNIKNELSKYKTTGKINLNFKIKSDFKTIKSEGIAEINDATISGNAINYRITNICSKINFANNNIKIEPSKMLVNGTPLTFSGIIDSKADINISAKGSNLDSEKITELFCPAEINKKIGLKGILGFTAEIKGNLKTPKTSFIINLKDFTITNYGKILTKFREGQLLFTGTLEKPNGQLTLKNANLLPNEFANDLKSSNLKILFTPEMIDIPRTTLDFNGNPIVIMGKISEYLREPFYEINLNGKIKSASLYSFAKKIKLITTISAATKGAITVNGKISGRGTNASIKADFNADANNYISCIVIKELLRQPSVSTLDAVIDGKNIIINDFALNKINTNGTQEKIATISGKIKNIDNPILDHIRFIVPKAMSFSLAQLKNSEITIKSDLILNGHISKPELRGNLDVKNIMIPEYHLRSRINEIVFEDNNIKITIPKLEIGKSKFNVTANINPSLSNKFTIKNLQVSSDYLDLDEINETFDESSSSPVYPGISIPITAEGGKANIKIFKTGGLQAENITCDISIKNNIMRMSNIQGTAYKGNIAGKSEYNFLHTATISDITGTNADIRPIIKAITGKNDEMSGIVDYKIKISTIGTKQIQQQRTAKGYMEFSAREGIMGPLGQFEHFLYAQNLISQSLIKTTVLSIAKAVKPQNTGIYTKANGKIEITGGNAYLKPITVEGPNMSIYMTGKINILNDLADVKIYGRISQKVENVLGDLTNPVPKTILSSSSETSIGNLFYDEYNTTVSKAITDAIPALNPDSGMPSRPFAVIIQGAPDSVKAVKSFKWIVGTTNAPIPKASYIEKQIQTKETDKTQTTTTNPVKKAIPKVDINNQEQKNPQEQQKKKEIPDFMNNLPDNYN